MDVLSILYWDPQGLCCPATILEDRGGGRVDVRALHPDGSVQVHKDTPHLAGPGSWSAPGERQTGNVLRAGGPEMSREDDRRWASTGYRSPQNRDRPIAVGEAAIYKHPRQGPQLAVIRRIELVQPRRHEKVITVDLSLVVGPEQLEEAIAEALRVPTGFLPHDRLIAGSTWRGISHGPGVNQWCWPLG